MSKWVSRTYIFSFFLSFFLSLSYAFTFLTRSFPLFSFYIYEYSHFLKSTNDSNKLTGEKCGREREREREREEIYSFPLLSPYLLFFCPFICPFVCLSAGRFLFVVDRGIVNISVCAPTQSMQVASRGLLSMTQVNIPCLQFQPWKTTCFFEGRQGSLNLWHIFVVCYAT